MVIYHGRIRKKSPKKQTKVPKRLEFSHFGVMVLTFRFGITEVQRGVGGSKMLDVCKVQEVNFSSWQDPGRFCRPNMTKSKGLWGWFNHQCIGHHFRFLFWECTPLKNFTWNPPNIGGLGRCFSFSKGAFSVFVGVLWMVFLFLVWRQKGWEDSVFFH